MLINEFGCCSKQQQESLSLRLKSLGLLKFQENPREGLGHDKSK
jgi:hypothetical protein